MTDQPDAVDREQELREHERKAAEHEPAERQPADRDTEDRSQRAAVTDPLTDPAAGPDPDRPAPPGTAGTAER